MIRLPPKGMGHCYQPVHQWLWTAFEAQQLLSFCCKISQKAEKAYTYSLGWDLCSSHEFLQSNWIVDCGVGMRVQHFRILIRDNGIWYRFPGCRDRRPMMLQALSLSASCLGDSVLSSQVILIHQAQQESKWKLHYKGDFSTECRNDASRTALYYLQQWKKTCWRVLLVQNLEILIITYLVNNDSASCSMIWYRHIIKDMPTGESWSWHLQIWKGCN